MYAKQSNSLLLINAFAASQLQNEVQVYDTNGNPKANKIFLPTLHHRTNQFCNIKLSDELMAVTSPSPEMCLQDGNANAQQMALSRPTNMAHEVHNTYFVE